MLEQCEVNVKSACDPNGFPLPNMTEVNSCLENGAIISNLNNNCTKLSGSKACSCWEGSDETEAAVEVIVIDDNDEAAPAPLVAPAPPPPVAPADLSDVESMAVDEGDPHDGTDDVRHHSCPL